MRELQVEIDTNSGFCFGVVYAIDLAEEILDEESKLYCLGDIVHNDEEVDRLRKKGLITIDHDQMRALKDEKVLIRAHGEHPDTYRIAIENNLQLIDASCPVVLKLQNRIKNSYDKKDNIFIYGKHGHAEIKGLVGQTKNEAVVFESLDELDIQNMPEEITLYSQTTKSTDKFYEIKKILKENGIKVNAYDTICRQVSNRDQELRTFSKRYDAIIFVAGKKSSNGKVLYQICKNENEDTFFVSSPYEINPVWLEGKSKIGVCGATSTPMWLMEKVKSEIEAFAQV